MKKSALKLQWSLILFTLLNKDLAHSDSTPRNLVLDKVAFTGEDAIPEIEIESDSGISSSTHGVLNKLQYLKSQSNHYYPSQTQYYKQSQYQRKNKNIPQHQGSYSLPDYTPYYQLDSYNYNYNSAPLPRPSRESRGRSNKYSSTIPSASHNSQSQVGFFANEIGQGQEYGNVALASEHSGHEQDYHTATHYKTVHKIDRSSFGLLGLLGLLSLLSNVLRLLMTTQTTTMMMMMMPGKRSDDELRLKRDTQNQTDDNDDKLEKVDSSVGEQLAKLLLPSLNVVGHAKDRRISLNCTIHEVCKTNKIIFRVMGADDGRQVALVLSKAIINLLVNKTDPKEKPFKSLLTEAAAAGRNGTDCHVAHPVCPALLRINDYENQPNSDSNFITGNSIENHNRLPLLVSPEKALAIILGES